MLLCYVNGVTNSCINAIFFFLKDPPPTEIYTVGNTLSLHDALPIYPAAPAAPGDPGAPARRLVRRGRDDPRRRRGGGREADRAVPRPRAHARHGRHGADAGPQPPAHGPGDP